MQGVENVYTQHTPLLASTLEALVKGRLRDTDFPCIGKAPASTTTPGKPPKLVVVFVVGGTTYEEAKAIADLNLQVRKALLLSHTHSALYTVSRGEVELNVCCRESGGRAGRRAHASCLAATVSRTVNRSCACSQSSR